MSDIAMPSEMIAWMKAKGWGPHHLRWHVERIWDRLPPEIIAEAKQRGWERYPIQEGEETNGLSFLAMHRVMIGMLIKEFPAHAELFAGWSTPPTDPNDPDDPVPANTPPPVGGPFSPDMARSIKRIEGDLATFNGDDDLGLFLETSWRPFPNQPTRRSSDSATGIHNYLHGRFARPETELDMGNPEVNIFNQRFWRLHGWIERAWINYRAATGRRDDDPRYRAAIEEAEHHMMHMAPMAAATEAAARISPAFTQAVARTLFGI
jgi:hypothetical protein